jgi:hypothetical protein
MGMAAPIYYTAGMVRAMSDDGNPGIQPTRLTDPNWAN